MDRADEAKAPARAGHVPQRAINLSRNAALGRRASPHVCAGAKTLANLQKLRAAHLEARAAGDPAADDPPSAELGAVARRWPAA